MDFLKSLRNRNKYRKRIVGIGGEDIPEVGAGIHVAGHDREDAIFVVLGSGVGGLGTEAEQRESHQ